MSLNVIERRMNTMNRYHSINIEQFNKDINELDNFFKSWTVELKEKYKSFNIKEDETIEEKKSRLYYNMEVVGKVPYSNGEEIELRSPLSLFYKKIREKM